MFTRPHVLSALVALGLVVTGCANAQPDAMGNAATATAADIESPVAPAAVSDPPQPQTPRPSVQLEARVHEAQMREIVLSPRGKAALTLDARGHVHLWPKVDPAATPWALPVREPLWMSLAPSEEGFLVAFVDTVGGTHVGRVEVDGETARWVDAFEVPPMDPMFEVHVLAGGSQILALGVDHVVRLWDVQGNTLAKLDEHGVIPWQLRVEHDDQGITHAALVAFAPVRIQRLAVSKDRLERVGEAYAVAIDQSPNRNDIAMSPDGRYATAMQKPSAKKGRFELEVVDLHDGSRRMLVAQTDTGFRPRVHPTPDEILADTGSGIALRLPLEAAVPWEVGADREALEPLEPDTLSIEGSDADSQMHATVRGGVHALAWGDSMRITRR